METDKGGLFYATGIDNSKLRIDAAESRNILASIGQTAVQEGNKMDAIFGRIAKAAGGVFAVGQIKEFTSNIIQLRGEIESFEISFNTLLGSDIKGSAMFKDIREFAVNTPMMLKDLASGAQTMLAFNIEAEKVMPMLRAIGDISMGDAQKFNSLTLAFSQMSATGKLMGQDLLQMINAGFNPLSVISEKTGKSIGELKEEMEKGKITTEMVTEAFISATSAGGKFYGMLEKQSKGTQGAISNLQGAIDDMYNDLGTAAQGATVEVIGGATTIVKHYKEIAEILAVIVGAYGAYKAVLIATEAVRRSVTAIKHTEEAAQIYAVMTAEQKAKISKLGLAETSEAYRAAVIAEMKTEMERHIQLAQTTQVELTAARERLATAESAKVAAAEKVASRQAEVEAAYASAAADQQSSTIKKIAAESEAQSRAALLAVKLEEQKNAAIAQARALKEAGASQEVIAAKNREIATISEKIATARAEEVQHSRNIVALRKEMAAQVDATTSKKIATAEAALETAQEELNTASKVRNTAAREVQSKAAAVNTAVRKAGTIETALDTAAETANATATGFLSAAKTKLTAVAAKLNAVIMANPWAIAAAAVVALSYGIYKLITYQTDAQKAQERLNKVDEDFNATCASEQIQIDTLFTRLKNAKEGTQEYKDAKDAILSQYGSYLQGLNNEIATLKDAEAAYKAVKQAALEAARARAMEAAVKGEDDAYGQAEGEQMKKLQEALKKRYGNKKNKSGQLLYLDYFDQLKRHIQNGGTIATLNADWLKGWDVKHEKYLPGDPMTNIGAQTLTYTTNEITEIYSKIGKARKVYDDALAQAEAMYGKAPEKKTAPAAAAKTEAQYNKKDWEDYKKAKQAEYDAMTEAERTSKKGRALAAEILRADQKVQGYNVTGSAKRGETAAAKQEREDNQIAVQTAERNQKIKEYAESVIKAQREAEFDIRQNEIDLLKDGVEKELKQVELNYDRLVFANQQRRAEMLEGIRDLKELEWENANPTAKKNGLTFDRSSVSDDYLSEANVAALREQGKNAEADRLQGMLDQLKAYSRIATEIRAQGEKEALDKMLGDVLTYEEQRLKIAEEYARKRAALYTEDENGFKVLRTGFSESNVAELNKQERKSLKELNSRRAAEQLEQLKGDINWDVIFGNVSNLTGKQLKLIKKQLQEFYNSSAFRMGATPEQLKTIADAMEKINEAERNNSGFFAGLSDALSTYDSAKLRFENAELDLNMAKQTGNKDIIAIMQKRYNEAQNNLLSAQGAVGDATDSVVTNFKTVSSALASLSNEAGISLTELGGTIETLINTFGNSGSKIGGIISAALSLLDAIGKQGLDGFVGKVLNGVSQGVGGVLDTVGGIFGIDGLGGLFNGDSRKEKRIESLQGSIDSLTRSNTRLERANSKLYSREKASSYGSQIDNLEAQKRLILQQMAEEEAKKDTNDDRIQEWRNQIEDIGQQIADLKEAAKDAIIGEDITTSIDNFATAMGDAWGRTADKAKAVKDYVRSMLRQMVVEAMKTDLTQPITQLREMMLGYMSDGIVSDVEQAEAQNFMSKVSKDISDRYKWADSILGGSASGQDGATKGGFATATQDSVDELGGRAAAIQICGEARRELLTNIRVDVAELKAQVAAGAEISAEMRGLMLIAASRLETIARNTEELYEMNERLGKIERNTR